MAKNHDEEPEESKIRDKRKIDPDTGDVREPQAEDGAPADPSTSSGQRVESAEDLVAAEDADVELSDDDMALLAEAERDLVGEYRERAARAEAELKNFRTRVERDRQANREAVIAEVIRSLLPAIDDLDRAEAHGDLTEGSPLAIVASKLRTGFEKYGLTRIGEKGEPFDPKFHEALVQLPSPDATSQTIADVIEVGYALGERLIRPAKVAVSVPA